MKEEQLPLKQGARVCFGGIKGIAEEEEDEQTRESVHKLCIESPTTMDKVKLDAEGKI